MNWPKITGILLAVVLVVLAILKITGIVTLSWLWIAAIPIGWAVFWFVILILAYSQDPL